VATMIPLQVLQAMQRSGGVFVAGEDVFSSLSS
jgi:hypothetical protein